MHNDTTLVYTSPLFLKSSSLQTHANTEYTFRVLDVASFLKFLYVEIGTCSDTVFLTIPSCFYLFSFKSHSGEPASSRLANVCPCRTALGRPKQSY